MDRAEAEAIYDSGREACVEFILELAGRVEQHEDRLRRLEEQARQDSRTSSIPPSTDPLSSAANSSSSRRSLPSSAAAISRSSTTPAAAPGATLARVERVALPAAQIQIADRRVSCETLFAYAGAFQLSLSTALPDEGVQFHSNYLGHEGAERSITSHLLIGQGAAPRVWSVEHDPASLPVMSARRYCLLDHLVALADELRQQTGLRVLLDVQADALD
jgi:uncharacterized protein DUF6444